MSSGRTTAGTVASEARHSRGKGSRAQERIEATLDGLEQLLHRLDHRQMEPGDWPLVRSLVSQLIGRVRGRHERMLAKVAAAAAAVEEETGQTGVDEDAPSDTGESADTASCSGVHAGMGNEVGVSVAGGDGETGKAAPDDSKRRKGHGRNGASAYRNAKQYSHPLAPSVIGALCESCKRSKMSRYREKIIIRIVGQPLFGADAHHHEQARCRNCGAIIRAQSPACVHEGLVTEYVLYNWSACGMLIVMHYFGRAPFKRLESLHQGWGVPMSDANQWELVNAADDRLLPLYRALEQHVPLRCMPRTTMSPVSSVLRRGVTRSIIVGAGRGSPSIIAHWGSGRSSTRFVGCFRRRLVGAASAACGHVSGEVPRWQVGRLLRDVRARPNTGWSPRRQDRLTAAGQ